MAILPQLVDPAGYRPCDWDLKSDAEGRTYWTGLFCQHLELLTELIAEEYPDANASQVAAFRRDYLDTMRTVEREPERYARVDVLLLTELRRDLCTRHGFEDPFLGIKQRENAASLELLPELLTKLDATPPEAQLEKLALGMLAGNVFDLGALPTIDRYRARNIGFRQTRASLPVRPWLIDDLEAWQDRWQESGYRHVLFFLDNAGSDVCLGCVPLARWMISAGARVTLVANSGPALNDVTAPEAAKLLVNIAERDEILRRATATGRLALIASGSNAPLLDLTALAPACAAAAHDADLIILHGMGRAIESNFQAPLRCDAVRTAVLKDPAVARHLDGQLFDCVFRFTRVTTGGNELHTRA